MPRLIRFSGALKDAAGKPIASVQDLTFSLYGVEAGGEALWFETQPVEADALGRYSVLLGAMHPDGLPMDLFTSGEARWLGVSVGRLPEQARVLLVSVPYALKAGDAETLAGKPATAFVASDQLKDQVRSEVKSQAAQSGTVQSTRTLIGTAPSPQAMGEGQSSFICNLAADCVAVTQSGAGVGLHATTSSNLAIFGESSSSAGRGVYGLATAGTGNTIGLWGGAYSTNGVGVFGRARAATGATTGVLGVSLSTSGVGVHGDAQAISGTPYGVWGSSASTSGVGVLGQASASSGATVGVRGQVSSTSGIAGIFDNTAGGKILSGRANNVEKFGVDGSGNVRANAYLDLAGNPVGGMSTGVFTG
ncbi:MAG: hypothetical protein ACREB3_12165, partial [Burkholderiales bacterium]